MKQVLIHKDERKIKQAQDFFKSSVSFLQQAYNKFEAAGFDLSFAHLVDIIFTLSKPDTETQQLKQTLITIGKSKDANYILPTDSDFTIPQIKGFINMNYPLGLGVYRFEPNLMTFKNGQVIANEDALKIIETRFSFYAENERGEQLSNLLSHYSEAVNNLSDYLLKNNIEFKQFGKDMPGLEFANAKYQPDISFIRDQERIFKNTRKHPNVRTFTDAA